MTEHANDDVVGTERPPDEGAGHDHHHDDFHDFSDQVDRLNDPNQFRYCSGEELRTFLDPRPDWTVVDLGSGTGLYVDELAPVVESVYAVDVDPAMHAAYAEREDGVPTNVAPITAAVGDLPLADGSCDGATSLKTFHHGVDDALDAVARLLRPGGRFVVVDWSATGAGDRERGPDADHCYDLATVQSMLIDAGFRIDRALERRATFVVVASRRSW